MATDVNYESQRHQEIWDKIKGGAGPSPQESAGGPVEGAGELHVRDPRPCGVRDPRGAGGTGGPGG